MPKILMPQNVFVKNGSGSGSGKRSNGSGSCEDGSGFGGEPLKLESLKNDKNLSVVVPSETEAENYEDDEDDFNSTSSIIEFLTNEQECNMEADAEAIFKEVNRLSDNNDTRSVDEILQEAQRLINQQQSLFMADDEETLNFRSFNRNLIKQKQSITMNSKFTKSIENFQTQKSPNRSSRFPISLQNSRKNSLMNGNVNEEDLSQCEDSTCENPRTESVLSQESVPKDMQSNTNNDFMDDDDEDATTIHINGYDSDDGTDTMEEITENMETMQVDPPEMTTPSANSHSNAQLKNPLKVSSNTCSQQQQELIKSSSHVSASSVQYRRTSVLDQHQNPNSSPIRRPNSSSTIHQQYDSQERRSSLNAIRSSLTTTPDSGIYQSQSQSQFSTSSFYSPKHFTESARSSPQTKSYADKSCNSSPKHLVSAVTSPIDSNSSFISREHNLKQEIEQLQEKLKDTEERLESIRIQNESLSQMQRSLRDTNSRLQEQSEVLKLDVQHLTECANVLRSELQAARTDRSDALELQKVLQTELEESRQEKKRALEEKDKDAKTIQDLQRQCKEMERILMRKYPDSISALIVANRNPKVKDEESQSSRKLLESRIAQLESDAKEQDNKAQEILANVQARFNAVQAKYETHIADLETQVLSLQEINAKLNEKIEFQSRSLEYLVRKRQDKYFNNCTQTDESFMELRAIEYPADANKNNVNVTQNAFTQTKTHHTRDHSTNTIGVPAACFLQSSPASSVSSTAHSTPNNSRPNSKQSGLRRPASGCFSSLNGSKLPISQSDTTISLSASTLSVKEDAHLIATIRSMRVDLAIKSKALQRLSRELDDCKKTMKKLQKERDLYKSEKQQLLSTSSNVSAASSRRGSSAHEAALDHMPANTESQALREALNKYKLLEADYKALHDKRLQDLKTLQTAHERELASCHETVRILQQRLNEREEQTAARKARKVPVDYYALKAKVSSLERRHTEREERLHLLVEALSKGRMNGALEDLLRDNNNE